MRTAIVSDLHLGSASGEDVLRDADGAPPPARGDRRRRPPRPARRRDRAARAAAAAALDAARPVLRGAGRGDGRARGRARPRQPRPPPGRAAARRRSRETATAGSGLEQRAAPARGAGGARSPPGSAPPSCAIAYPGVWLRDDVYATHGHYMDCHMTLPRAECLAAATLMRAFGPVPEPGGAGRLRAGAAPGLRLLLRRSPRPSLALRATRPSEARLAAISGRDRPAGAPAAQAAIAGRASAPASRPTIWALNRLLRSELRARHLAGGDLRSGVDGGDRAGARLRARRRPRDHRPHPPRRPERRAKPRGRWPAAAASTTPAAGSSPPPSTTPARRPAPTGRGRSPGSRTRGRRAASRLLHGAPARGAAAIVAPPGQLARRLAESRATRR